MPQGQPERCFFSTGIIHSFLLSLTISFFVKPVTTYTLSTHYTTEITHIERVCLPLLSFFVGFSLHLSMSVELKSSLCQSADSTRTFIINDIYLEHGHPKSTFIMALNEMAMTVWHSNTLSLTCQAFQAL